jgi:hypothetical protein
VSETSDPLEDMRGVAVQMLRAQRHDDRPAFLSAWSRVQTGTDAEALLLSLCQITNGLVDKQMTKEQADEFIERLAARLPTREQPEDTPQQTRLDAVAIFTALHNADPDGVRSIIKNTPDLGTLLAQIVQVAGLLLGSLEPDGVEQFLTAARNWANGDGAA